MASIREATIFFLQRLFKEQACLTLLIDQVTTLASTVLERFSKTYKSDLRLQAELVEALQYIEPAYSVNQRSSVETCMQAMEPAWTICLSKIQL